MPQELRLVPLVLKDQPNAIAVGNNASWLCYCGHLLIGRTGLSSGVTDGYRVDCACGVSYEVVPEPGSNHGRVSSVREII